MMVSKAKDPQINEAMFSLSSRVKNLCPIAAQPVFHIGVHTPVHAGDGVGTRVQMAGQAHLFWRQRSANHHRIVAVGE
jgi:hypothetical protein